MIGRPGIMIRRIDPKRPKTVEKSLDVRFGKIPERLPPGSGAPDRFIVHVGQVHDLKNAESGETEESLQEILENIGPEISDVGNVINRRTAGVEPDFARDKRLKIFVLAAEGVMETNHGVIL
jgi:hypothetical protein